MFKKSKQKAQSQFTIIYTLEIPQNKHIDSMDTRGLCYNPILSLLTTICKAQLTNIWKGIWQWHNLVHGMLET